MLYTETVERTTLELLRHLEGEPELSQFALAGGTALALYLGHRVSVDLDLFSPSPFDAMDLKDFLEQTYGFRVDFMKKKNTLKGTINGVKVDCLTYEYDSVQDIHVEDGIRLYSLEDISAMKLSAIADNGTRLKDFIDVACLSTRLSLYSMLKFYERKFPDTSVIRPLKAVTYFDDIDFNENIVMLNGNYKWENIEKRLADMTKNQDKIFNSFPLKIIKDDKIESYHPHL